MGAHAWFLDWVRRRSAALSAELHSPNGVRPFTVSDIRWKRGLLPGAAGTRVAVPGGQPASLRITSLDSRLTELILGHLGGLNGELHLDGADFEVREVACFAHQHPEAGWADQRMLTTAASGAIPRWVEVRFVSPTAFRQAGRSEHRPTPRLAFGSWLRRWDALFPDHAFGDEFVDALDQSIKLESASLRVARVKLSDHLVEGGVGVCRYTLPLETHLASIAHTLAQFSFWAGTGKSTAWGLGQTRPRFPAQGGTKLALRASTG
jgi:CRISPR-associated endoribonuclease Cas6